MIKDRVFHYLVFVCFKNKHNIKTNNLHIKKGLPLFDSPSNCILLKTTMNSGISLIPNGIALLPHGIIDILFGITFIP